MAGAHPQAAALPQVPWRWRRQVCALLRRNLAVVTVLVPPPRTRFWFWSVGVRLAPEYRPWVAQQIASPGYPRRRLWPSLALQTVLVVIPQTALALAAHSRLRLIAPGALIVLYAVVVVRSKTLPQAARRRLLAYHGVAADGTLRDPVSARLTNPLGKAGIVLLSAQVLIFSSGVAVAADRIAARRACHLLPAADMAALAAAVGQPVPTAATAFGAPDPIVAPGTPLVAAREVDGGLDGVHFAAAYARDPSGRIVGPAVWRIIDPATILNPGARPDVGAQDTLARQITPNTGYGFNSPEDPALAKARDCAKAAR